MDKLVRMIATMAFDDTVPLARIMMRSLRRNTNLPIVLFVLGNAVPQMGEDRRITLSVDEIWKSLYDRVNRGVNDKAKALMFPALNTTFGTKEIFYIDADCLVLKPVDDVFRFRGGFLMAREKLDFYKPYLEAIGSPSPELTFNAGVLLFRFDCYYWWTAYYKLLCEKFDEQNHPRVEGQTIWNAVWHKHLGESAILPQRYNQLHVKHGPEGAVVYHLAGLSQNSKLAVMKNLYQHFYGEEV